MRARSIWVTALLLAPGAPAAAQDAEVAAAHAADPPFELDAAALAARAARRHGTPLRAPLRTRVFGYLPYWGGDWTGVRLDLLTSVSWFNVALAPDGTITERHGWGNATSRAFVDEAKRAGVKVSLCATLFGSADIAALLGDPARRAAAVEALLAEVRAGGAEGINIDFEFVPRASKEDFVLFMRELSARFWREIPGSEVSIAMPSVDSAGAYDFDELAAASDLLFVMGYGYHWSGGGPGPLSPVRSGAIWGAHNLRWTIEDYDRYGGPNIRDKLVLGMPFYGYEWPAASEGVPSARGTGDASARLYRDMAARIAQHGRRWDAESGTPYLVWSTASGARQLFYDDAESWREKLDLVLDEGLAGAGIWALTYERGTDLWPLFAEKLVVPPEPAADAGAPDAEVDAGALDAAAVDAGALDAAAAPDAEAAADAARAVGEDDAGARVIARLEPADEGCRCTGAARSWVAPSWVLAAVLWARRRRAT